MKIRTLIVNLPTIRKPINDNLILKSFDGVKITGFTYGDTFEEIEKDLIGGIENEI